MQYTIKQDYVSTIFCQYSIYTNMYTRDRFWLCWDSNQFCKYSETVQLTNFQLAYIQQEKHLITFLRLASFVH